MSRYLSLATIINRCRSPRRSRVLTVLVCLALGACGPAASPDVQTVGGAPGTTLSPSVKTITTEQVLDIVRDELPSFRAGFSQCQDQADATGRCAKPAYLELGFNDQQELDQATLGPPYHIYQLEPSMLKRYAPPTQVATLITPGTTWLVPIVSRNEGRAGIEVDGASGVGTVFWYGGPDKENDLSRNLMTVHNQYSGTSVNLTLIKVEHNHHRLANVMLLTEGTHESLVILSGQPYAAPNIRRDLQPNPPEQLIPALAASVPGDCPQGQQC